MRLRFTLLAIFAASTLHATSMTSASCGAGSEQQSTTGTSSASCSVSLYIDGTYYGEAQGAGDISVSTGFISVEGSGGFMLTTVSVPYPLEISGGGTASYSQTFTTAGPVRQGIISFNLNSFGGGSGGEVTQNGEAIAIENGSYFRYVELGESFTIQLTATDGGGGAFPCNPNDLSCYPSAAGDASASLSYLSLYEANGTTPVPYFVTPEPASWRFSLLGFVLCAGGVLTIRGGRNAFSKSGLVLSKKRL